MRAGGFAFAGGTCRAGGSIDAEERYYWLLQKHLGDGVFQKLDGDVRSRWLMSVARGLATMENEAIKSARESVPCLAIDQLDEWEKIFGVELIAGVLTTTKRRQDFMRATMGQMMTTSNIERMEAEVIRLLTEERADVNDVVFGYENTGATAIGIDGVRYSCILVPWEEPPGPGQWLVTSEYRTLFRAIEARLYRWESAHAVVSLCISDVVGPPARPAFFTDNYRGCALGKDVPGT